MEQEILNRISQLEEKNDKIYQSVEKSRKYLMWMLIIAVATVVLPLIASAIILPMVLSSISSTYNEINSLGL